MCAGIAFSPERLQALEDMLQSAQGGCLGLWGMRGLGKSTLARALVARLQQHFPGRTCVLEFPVVAPGAPVDIQQLRRELVLAALHALGVPLHARGKGEPAPPGAHPWQACPMCADRCGPLHTEGRAQSSLHCCHLSCCAADKRCLADMPLSCI